MAVECCELLPEVSIAGVCIDQGGRGTWGRVWRLSRPSRGPQACRPLCRPGTAWSAAISAPDQAASRPRA